jgi:hypothetical protein
MPSTQNICASSKKKSHFISRFLTFAVERYATLEKEGNKIGKLRVFGC